MIIGVIPARGGSKRIRRKNIAECAGKPLLAWTADAALASKLVGRAILSTDDPEIAELGRELGLEVPFMRPDNLANDRAPMLPVLAHILDWAIQDSLEVEGLLLLQPTSPLRTADHIDEAISLFRSQRPESVVSVTEVPHRFHPAKLLQVDADGCLEPHGKARDPNDKSAMVLETCYGRNGPAILLTRPHVVQAGKLYGAPTIPYVMAAGDSVDIDEPDDLLVAETILSRRLREQ